MGRLTWGAQGRGARGDAQLWMEAHCKPLPSRPGVLAKETVVLLRPSSPWFSQVFCPRWEPPKRQHIFRHIKFVHVSELSLFSREGGNREKRTVKKKESITRSFFSPFMSLINREKLCVNREKSAPKIHHFFTGSFSPFPNFPSSNQKKKSVFGQFPLNIPPSLTPWRPERHLNVARQGLLRDNFAARMPRSYPHCGGCCGTG